MLALTSPFTPDSELDLLFSPDLISHEVKNQLHADVHVRWAAKPSGHVGVDLIHQPDTPVGLYGLQTRPPPGALNLDQHR